MKMLFHLFFIGRNFIVKSLNGVCMICLRYNTRKINYYIKSIKIKRTLDRNRD